MIEDLKARYGIDATENSIRELYSHVYHPNRSEGFFARSIILAEGTTEQYALPIYAEAAGFPLNSLNISVVYFGGAKAQWTDSIESLTDNPLYIGDAVALTGPANQGIRFYFSS